MILLDTSILIGYFKKQEGSPYEKMEHVVNNNMPYGICNYVYQELLQGSGNMQEYELLKDYLNTVPFYELKHGKLSFENASKIYMNCCKKGLTVKNTLSLLIAEIAIENELYLLHDDEDYTNIATVCKNLKIY